MFIGSTVGAYIPMIWGDNMSSVILTAVGGLMGIWLGYKINKSF